MAAMGIAESVCRLSLGMGLTNCLGVFLFFRARGRCLQKQLTIIKNIITAGLNFFIITLLYLIKR